VTNQSESIISEQSIINQISLPTQYVHISKATSKIHRDRDLHQISTMSLSTIDCVYNL